MWPDLSCDTFSVHGFHLILNLLYVGREWESKCTCSSLATWLGSLVTREQSPPRLGPKTPESSHQNPVSLKSSASEDIHGFTPQERDKRKWLKEIELRYLNHFDERLSQHTGTEKIELPWKEYIPYIQTKQSHEGSCLVWPLPLLPSFGKLCSTSWGPQIQRYKKNSTVK